MMYTKNIAHTTITFARSDPRNIFLNTRKNMNYFISYNPQNKAFTSSILFGFSGIIAFIYLPTIDVAMCCLLCMYTSLWNHSLNCADRVVQKIDQTIVRSVGFVYTIHSILILKNDWLFYTLMFTTVLTIALYKHLSYDKHWLIHVSSNVGIVIYVFARINAL